MRITLGQRLDQCNGIGPGFDHLRVGLASAIILWHSFGIPYGHRLTELYSLEYVQPFLAIMLPCFFALSGFLVTGSALRINDLGTFVTFRVLRIVPALATELTLSALVLGPSLTTYELRDYFTDYRFIDYFGSLIGRVRYVLPGLFVDNPGGAAVNGALWTVGPEILCYVIMSLLILTALYRRPWAMLTVTVVYGLACVASDLVVPEIFHEVLPVKSLILCYLVGSVLYSFRGAIPWSATIAIGGLIVALVTIYFAQNDDRLHALIYVATPLLSYLTIAIGLLGLPKLPLFHRGDYSYGLYIYGFPIQQSVTYFFAEHRTWWFNFLVSYPLTLCFAILSWTYIEKPALRLRKLVLKSHKPAMPVGILQWRGKQWLIAVLLALYGVWVTDQSYSFPLRPIVKMMIYHEAPTPVNRSPF